MEVDLGTPAARKRAANDLLRRSDSPLVTEGHWPLPFFCECMSERCVDAVWLDPQEYDVRRSGDPTWTPLASGHAPETPRLAA